MLVIAATTLGACGSGAATPTPASTEVPIGPTPWPSGTTGQYGLHIDPSLLGKLPPFVHAQPIVEDAGAESSVLNDPNLPKTVDGYVAGSVGNLGEDNWLKLAVVRFKPDLQSPDTFPDTYTSWESEYATGACSQANGVATTSQIEINGWTVDESTCGGGVVVYSLPLGSGIVLSMFGLGPLDYGRLLIEALY